MSTDVAYWVYGMLGGLLVEFVGAWKLRQKSVADWPIHYKSFSYYALTIPMIVVGGFVAWLQLYHFKDIKIELALQVGATAPLFLERFFSNKADISGDED